MQDKTKQRNTMRFIDIFLSESAKSELLASKQGPKLLAALKRDRLADQEMTADQLTVELESMDPTNGKMLQWLVNQYAAGIFKLEDAPRVSTALTDFVKKKRSLEKKDINQYKRLSDLEDAVEDTKAVSSKKQQKQEIKTQGADTVFESNTYSIVKLRTEEAACAYGKGTKWCTAADHDNMFGHYNKQGPLFVILDHANNRKYQLQLETAQFMDEKDHEVDYSELSKKYPEINNVFQRQAKQFAQTLDLDEIDKDEGAFDIAHMIFDGRWRAIESRVAKHSFAAYIYATEVLEARWPEAEPNIAKDAESALYYAQDVLKARWPEAEPYIAKDAKTASLYAQDVLKARWPEAEPNIAKDAKTAYYYANEVVEGRWPEAEPFIAKHAKSATDYAMGVIGARWPAAEPAIADDSTNAYLYARYVIKARWPEAEQSIMKDEYAAIHYAKYVIKGRWPEAEPYIATDSYWWQMYNRQVPRI
jgi:hypothetical protein